MIRKAESNLTAYQPPGWPILGNLPQYMRDRLGFLLECASTGHAVIRLQLDAPVYLLNDVDDIKHVMEKNYLNYDKTARLTSARGRRISGHGLLTSRGAEHLERRRMLQPVFVPSSFMPLSNEMVRLSNDTFSHWSDNDEIDVAPEMLSLSQRIIGQLMFGVDFQKDARELGEAFVIRRRYLHGVFASLLPFPEYLPTRTNISYRRAEKIIRRDVTKFIAERRANPSRYRDMLAIMMQARHQDDRPMSDEEIMDETITTNVTGYETIGDALAWTCYNLATHPHVQRAVADELQSALNGRAPSANDIPQLPQLQMVISESLRLYPATWIIVRVARDQDTLPSGVTIPAGARLYACPWVIHRDSRYFPNPDRFDPQRFNEANRSGLPKYAYFPFGGGTRNCIGQAMAKVEAALVLACLLQQFSFTLAPGQRIVPTAGMTLHARDGIRVILNRRDRADASSAMQCTPAPVARGLPITA